MNDNTSIGFGSAAFLVKDKSIAGNPYAEIYKWLEREGFSRWKYSKGHYDGVDWIYINVNSKVYANGMPGIAVTKAIGNRMISLEDFMIIYNILQKYKERTTLSSVNLSVAQTNGGI